MQLLAVAEIEMHNMNQLEESSASQAEGGDRLYIESLLEKFPDITDQERLEILHFLSNAPAIDTALLTCNDAIRENLEAFKQENRKQLGVTWKNWVYLIVLLSLFTIAIYFLWGEGVSVH